VLGHERPIVSVAVFETDTPLDRYLAEQADLTAVDRFSRFETKHDELRELGGPNVYRSLIPLAQPKAGEQYAFAVDLDTCTGCKACVTACHSLNGLDDDESWRSVGLLHTAATSRTDTTTSVWDFDTMLRSAQPTKPKPTVAPRQQHVTTGCHHCVDPACLTGCPVNAYEKDPITGIVAHLDDQCIGCGYCTLTCPYEVPRYNEKRGIVRKCDMCAGRLAVGEAPACVQACPNEAITITIVNQAQVRAQSSITRLVPGAPLSQITSPTTQFKTTSSDTLATMQPADLFVLRPAQAHPPLAIMLVLTQLSVGAFVVDFLLQLFISPTLIGKLRPYDAGAALVMGVIALAASVFHLGRPRYAFRVVLGFRHSWLSREAVAFGAFAAAASAYAFALWFVDPLSTLAARALGGIVAVTGVIGVFCSIQIYVSTKRVWWAWRYTGLKFLLTSAICGVAATLVTTMISSFVVGDNVPLLTATQIGLPLVKLLAGLTVAKLGIEVLFLLRVRLDEVDDRKRTALLLIGPLGRVTRMRFGLGLLGGVLLPLVVTAVFLNSLQQTDADRSGVAFAAVAFVCALCIVTAGELVERYQYFRAVVVSRMPGAPA
jgi:formate dehydrogenase iron-sulfur subunit